MEVEDRVLRAIDPGLLVFLGVGQADTLALAAWLVEKIATLRIFPDPEDKLNLSLFDTGGVCLVVEPIHPMGRLRQGLVAFLYSRC
ncbi:D-aminoacyl-tRNA deacylase [Desulfarculales bacterium]